MSNRKVGFVIAVDGPDGVGKTTQVELLKKYLEQKGYAVHITRQSGGTPIGEELRKASLSEHERSAETDLYISLAMGTALAEDTQKRKKHGEVVIIDRSPLAIVAYNGYGSQLQDKPVAFEACQLLLKQEAIDMLFFLNASQPILNTRRHKRRSKDYFEKKNSAYHERVRQGYKAGLEFLGDYPELAAKVIMIDASMGISAIHETIVNVVKL